VRVNDQGLIRIALVVDGRQGKAAIKAMKRPFELQGYQVEERVVINGSRQPFSQVLEEKPDKVGIQEGLLTEDLAWWVWRIKELGIPLCRVSKTGESRQLSSEELEQLAQALQMGKVCP
jgi:hypothetical protein